MSNETEKTYQITMGGTEEERNLLGYISMVAKKSIETEEEVIKTFILAGAVEFLQYMKDKTKK